jgi:hypothetical protein
MRAVSSVLFAVVAVAAACGGTPSSTSSADAAPDMAPPPPDAGKDAACASTFGNALTASFGRVDGTVVAVVQPGDMHCAQINGDHVVVQVSIGGAVYRMVVNVLPTGGTGMIRIRSLDAPLPAPAFAEGWHPGLALDYPGDLGVHATDAAWAPYSLADATAHIGDAIAVGAPIAVYATSSGGSYADSAHLVHRHAAHDDGAIVIDPTSAHPRWLLFSFADQTF